MLVLKKAFLLHDDDGYGSHTEHLVIHAPTMEAAAEMFRELLGADDAGYVPEHIDEANEIHGRIFYPATVNPTKNGEPVYASPDGAFVFHREYGQCLLSEIEVLVQED